MSGTAAGHTPLDSSDQVSAAQLHPWPLPEGCVGNFQPSSTGKCMQTAMQSLSRSVRQLPEAHVLRLATCYYLSAWVGRRLLCPRVVADASATARLKAFDLPEEML